MKTTVYVVQCDLKVVGVYTDYDNAVAMLNVCKMENQDATVYISVSGLDDTSDLYNNLQPTPEYLAKMLCEGCHVHPMAENDIIKELTPLLGGTRIAKYTAYKFLTGAFSVSIDRPCGLGAAWLVCKKYMDLHDKYVNCNQG